MGKILFFIAIFFSVIFTTNGQSGINWSAPIVVSADSDGDDSPRLALTTGGTPVVLWGHQSKIYFSRMVDDSFIAPEQVSTNGINPDIYGFGGLDLATYGDDVFIVFENFSAGVHLVRSSDGGQNFELPISVYDPPSNLWATLASVEADDNGNPLVSVIRELPNETQASFILMRSVDGGATFSEPVVASEPAPGEFVCECCPSDIFSQEDKVWLIFRNNDDNLRDMWVSRSSDGGETFDTAVDVDDTDWVVSACPISGPRLAPLAGDSLLTVWMSGTSGSGRVSFSTLDGAAMEKGWEMEFPQTNENANQVRPDVAGQNDTIGVVWEENGFGVNSVDLMFAFSKNGANGLTSNFVNLTNVGGAQRFPALAYSDGLFHLVYANGSGGLEYMRGEVSELSAAAEVDSKMLEVKVVPQPVLDGKIGLQFGTVNVTELDFQLFDVNGKMIKQWLGMPIPVGNKLTLEIGQQLSGVYYLEGFSPKGKFSRKIIVQN